MRVKKWIGQKCAKCERPVKTMEFCQKHYYYLWKMTHPQSYLRHRDRQIERRKERLDADPKLKEEYARWHREASKKWVAKRLKTDPDYRKKQMASFRAKHPDYWKDYYHSHKKGKGLLARLSRGFKG